MGTQIYPRGAIAFGSSDLVEVTNVKVTTTNNAKQLHTLRQKGAGTTLGVEETTVTYDAIIGEFGEEADYVGLVKAHTIKEIRIKIPGRTITVQGQFKMTDYELPLDDAIKQSIEFIGHLVD